MFFRSKGGKYMQVTLPQIPPKKEARTPISDRYSMRIDIAQNVNRDVNRMAYSMSHQMLKTIMKTIGEGGKHYD